MGLRQSILSRLMAVFIPYPKQYIVPVIQGGCPQLPDHPLDGTPFMYLLRKVGDFTILDLVTLPSSGHPNQRFYPSRYQVIHNK